MKEFAAKNRILERTKKSGTKADAASPHRSIPHYDSGRTCPYHSKRARLFSQLIVQPNPELAKPSPVRVRASASGSFRDKSSPNQTAISFI
jgi:hypothetical protein